MSKNDFDKINRTLFKDMPSALRDNDDIKAEKSMNRLMGTLKVFAIAATTIVGTALYLDKDAPEEAPKSERTEITMDHSPE